jgi:Cu(I)/Ag(I) efflux system membrane fusion protein
MNPKIDTDKEDAFIKVAISEQEKQEFEAILSNYLIFKDALVEDDFSSAKKLNAKMGDQIKSINKSQFSSEVGKIWESFQKKLLASTNTKASAQDIKEMRNNFDEFSEIMIGLVKTFQLTNKELYVLHCPMTNNNKGADWLSASSEVKNPYYGSDMLGCGELKSTIK